MTSRNAERVDSPASSGYTGAPMARPGLLSVGSLTGIHVLLVDEDPQSRPELVAILSYCGSLLSVAESEADAVRLLELARPDVIVLAIARHHRGEMPLVPMLRADTTRNLGTIPIIAIIWPGDVVTAGSATIVELRRPLDAWEVCRALANAVTVE